MANTVFVVPGILGSAIGWSRSGRLSFPRSFTPEQDAVNALTKYIWPNPYYLSTTGWEIITLAADGKSPETFQFGMPLVADTVIIGVYTALIKACEKFGTTQDFPFDWRLSIFDTGQELANQIAARPAGEDIYIVAHSMGGLVSRMAWGLLAQSDKDRVKRIVTLGTPHFGAYGSVVSEYGLGPVFDNVIQFSTFGTNAAKARLRQKAIPALQSFPGLACLFPNRQSNSPDPWRSSSAKAWNLAWYGTAAKKLTQRVLDIADIAQASLPTNEPQGLIACVVGVGFATIDGDPLYIDGDPEQGRFRAFDSDGDGQVEPWSATYPPGAPTVKVPVAHQDLLSDGRVLAMIPDLLANGVRQQSTVGGYPNPPGKPPTPLPFASYPMQPLDP